LGSRELERGSVDDRTGDEGWRQGFERVTMPDSKKKTKPRGNSSFCRGFSDGFPTQLVGML
jgi:hypothetical protein